MSKLLDQALEELMALPEDAQDAIAADLLEMVRSEAKWDRLFDDQRSDALMDKMAAKARSDIALGKVVAGDPSDRDDYR